MKCKICEDSVSFFDWLLNWKTCNAYARAKYEIEEDNRNRISGKEENKWNKLVESKKRLLKGL